LSAHAYHITGHELSIRISEQGPRAFDELFHHLYAPLCVFAGRYVNDQEAARDIVADLFLSAWKDQQTLVKVEDVPAYLYGAARYKSLNYLKHHNMLKKHERQLQAELIATEQTPIEQPIYEAETIRMLYEAIDQLPPECRQVVRMSLQHFSTNEIARELNITAGAVSNQKARALRLLKVKIPALLAVILEGLLFYK
jgi:RNA polymerase sigma-70 factor (family 1)